MANNNDSLFDQLEAALIAGKPSGTTVADALALLGAPSLSIAVLEEGIVTSRCYSNAGGDTQTVYQAASISKAINALAVMRLIEQGRMTLGSTVKDMLPNDLLEVLIDGSPESQKPLIEGINVKQLLSHTSGLSVSGIFGNYDDNLPTTKESLLGSLRATNARVRQIELPGGKALYSGGGITVLQAMMEHVTGQKYSDLMRELVLEPLEMTRSWYGTLPKEEKNAASSYITGYQPFGIKHFNFPTEAAAGLWSTPSDLLKAIIAVQKSLDGENESFLKQETVQAMLEEADSNQALSWAVRKDSDGKLCAFLHTGHNPPSFTSLVVGLSNHSGSKQVAKNSGIALMANSTEGLDVGTRLSLAICHLKGWYSGWIRADRIPLGIPHEKTGLLWKQWEGNWTDQETKQHTYEIKGDGDGDGNPALFYNGVGPLRLIPAAGHDTRKEDGFTGFVIEGMEILVSLQEKDGEKILQLTQDSGTKSLKKAV